MQGTEYRFFSQETASRNSTLIFIEKKFEESPVLWLGKSKKLIQFNYDSNLHLHLILRTISPRCWKLGTSDKDDKASKMTSPVFIYVT